MTRDLHQLDETYTRSKADYLSAVDELKNSTMAQDAAWECLRDGGDPQSCVLRARFVEARRRWIIANKTHVTARNSLDRAVRDLVEPAGCHSIVPRLSDYGVL